MNVRNVRKELLQNVQKFYKYVDEKKFSELAGYVPIIHETLGIYRKSIESYISQELKDFLESQIQFTFSVEQVQKEKEQVYTWFCEIAKITDELIISLKSRNMEFIIRDLYQLNETVGYDKSLIELVNTLKTFVHEYGRTLIRDSRDNRGWLFHNLGFHPIVRKASKSLFIDGYFPQAIFEASKALIKHVEKKAKIKTLKASDLMAKVFNIKYTTNPLEIIEEPILRLNSLRTLEEMDEQYGFRFLFQGTVIGIRNPKAHTEVIQKDQSKTLEYLSLISLLAKQTDEAVYHSD